MCAEAAEEFGDDGGVHYVEQRDMYGRTCAHALFSRSQLLLKF
jgi:hypothetical protein